MKNKKGQWDNETNANRVENPYWTRLTEIIISYYISLRFPTKTISEIQFGALRIVNFYIWN